MIGHGGANSEIDRAGISKKRYQLLMRLYSWYLYKVWGWFYTFPALFKGDSFGHNDTLCKIECLKLPEISKPQRVHKKTRFSGLLAWKSRFVVLSACESQGRQRIALVTPMSCGFAYAQALYGYGCDTCRPSVVYISLSLCFDIYGVCGWDGCCERDFTSTSLKAEVRT